MIWEKKSKNRRRSKSTEMESKLGLVRFGWNGVHEINWIIAHNNVSFVAYYQCLSTHNVAIS